MYFPSHRPPSPPSTQQQSGTHSPQKPAQVSAATPAPGWVSGLNAHAAAGAAPASDFASAAAASSPAAVQAEALAHVAKLQSRVDHYHQGFKMDRSVGSVPRQGSARFVEDEFPSRYDFQHEGQQVRTHFNNRFHIDPANPRTIRRVEAVENYKSPEITGFFASDVLLSQMAAAVSPARKPAQKIDLLNELPEFPPRSVVRDTIDNAATKEVLNQLNPQLAPRVELRHGSPELRRLLATPNGKATRNFIDEYNRINQARGLPQVEIDGATIYKSGDDPDSGWKFEVTTRFAGPPN